MHISTIKDALDYLFITYSDPFHSVRLEFNDQTPSLHGYFNCMTSLVENGQEVNKWKFIVRKELPEEITIDGNSIFAITLFEKGNRIYYRTDTVEENNLLYSMSPEMVERYRRRH